MKVEGLYLWEVKATYKWKDLGQWRSGTVGLWITTGSDSLMLATKKARTFLKRARARYPSARVTSVTAQGTLDA